MKIEVTIYSSFFTVLFKGWDNKQRKLIKKFREEYCGDENNEILNPSDRTWSFDVDTNLYSALYDLALIEKYEVE